MPTVTSATDTLFEVEVSFVPFGNITLGVVGTGMTYSNGVPIGGTLTQINIVTSSNDLTVKGFDETDIAVLAALDYTVETVDDIPDFIAQFTGVEIHLNGAQSFDLLSYFESNDIVVGSTSYDEIYVGAGDDIVDGGKGQDEIYGGAGNDMIDGGNARGELYGGEGDDVVIGGDASDDIYGDNDGGRSSFGIDGNDELFGGGGGDYMLGGDGDDLMKGGDDRDTMYGGWSNSSGNDDISDDDMMYGGKGGDYMAGNRGDDQMEGRAGHDYINGGSGDDTVLGGKGDDTIFGGDSFDYYGGQTDNDNLSGRAGNDLMYGGYGDDIMAGGADTDLLIGGRGSDDLSGGKGVDILHSDGDSFFGGVGRRIVDEEFEVDMNTMTGGQDADIFAFNDYDMSGPRPKFAEEEYPKEIIAITDFTDGEDLLMMLDGNVQSGATQYQTFKKGAVEDGSDVVYETATSIVILENMSLDDISADDFALSLGSLGGGGFID